MTMKYAGLVLLAAGIVGAPAVHAQSGDDERPSSADAERAPAPAAAGARPARNTLDLGTTSITGNRELPKVLYIVPWKRSDLADLVGRPVNTLLDEVLAPIDPDEFERHLDYYGLLYADGASAQGAPRRADTEEE
ncbi:MAG: hypothetical protein LOD94_03680 [Gammaproteobacteria bacterium]